MKTEIINAGTITIRNPLKKALSLSNGEGRAEMGFNVVSTYKSQKGGDPVLQSSALQGNIDVKLYIPLTAAPKTLISDYAGLSVGVEIAGTNSYYFPMCIMDSINGDGDCVFIVQNPSGCDACYKNQASMITEANSS